MSDKIQAELPKRTKVTLNLKRANRRRNRKQRKTKKIRKLANPALFKQIVINEKAILDDVHRLYQNLFFPTCGTFRTVGVGMNETAICTFRGAYDVTIPNTAVLGGLLTWCFFPFQCTANSTATTSAQWFSFGSNATGGAGYLDPTGNAIGVTKFGGPFGPFGTSTNPSVRNRSISCEFIITPATNLLNQAGEGVIAYSPTMYNDLNGLTGSNLTDMFNKQQFSVPWNGTQEYICHWVPNAQESDMTTGSTSVPSGFGGYLFIPPGATAGSVYRFSWSLTVEYEPNNLYRPFVETILPGMHPSTYYYVNKIANRNWNPLIVSKLTDYMSEKAIYEHRTGGFVRERYAITNFGFNGLGGSVGKAPEQLLQEDNVLNKEYERAPIDEEVDRELIAEEMEREKSKHTVIEDIYDALVDAAYKVSENPNYQEKLMIQGKKHRKYGNSLIGQLNEFQAIRQN